MQKENIDLIVEQCTDYDDNKTKIANKTDNKTKIVNITDNKTKIVNKTVKK